MKKNLLIIGLCFFAIANEAQTWCIPAMTVNTNTTGISNVSLNSINRTSAVAEGYINTALTATVLQGSTYTLSVQFAGMTAPGVWIDWNANGSFMDVGETIVSPSGSWYPTTGTAAKIATVNIPGTSALGTTRMRVYAKAFGTGPVTSPCNTGDIAGDIEDYNIFITATTGMMENQEEDKLGIYPNPFSDIIKIENVGSALNSISIYDYIGRILKTESITKDKYLIDLSELATGVYFVMVKSENGKCFSKKIVKQ